MDSRKYNISVTLLDETSAIIRAVCPDDKNFLIDSFGQQSRTSIINRFFYNKKRLTDSDLAYLTELDFITHVALLAMIEVDGTDCTVGVGRFIVETNQSSAEVALIVDDFYQGLGIATHLLRHLAIIGRALGIREFTADVLPENEPMLRIFRKSGLGMETHISEGVCKVKLNLGTAKDESSISGVSNE